MVRNFQVKKEQIWKSKDQHKNHRYPREKLKKWWGGGFQSNRKTRLHCTRLVFTLHYACS